MKENIHIDFAMRITNKCKISSVWNTSGIHLCIRRKSMRLIKIDIFTLMYRKFYMWFFFLGVGRVIFCVMLYLLCRMQHIHIRISTALNNAVQFHVVK